VFLRLCFTLDIPESRILAVEEPAAFLQKHKPPVIIDEFQYAPNLLPYIKAYVDELAFYKIMRVCAGLAASPVDFTNIANKVGISVNKAKEWVSILVSSGIVILISPYFNNALKRVVKTPRLYFADTGLLCYLRGIDNAEVLEKLADSGDFFENYVVSEVYKSFTNAGMRPQLHYYRDANNRKEIDLLIERNGILYPIEIKESTNPDKKAAKNFSAIAPVGDTNMKIGTGTVICTANDLYPLCNDAWAVPHWLV